MGVCYDPLSIIMEMLNGSLLSYLMKEQNIDLNRKKQLCLGIARGKINQNNTKLIN